MTTALERSIAVGRRRAQPLDALARARRAFLAGERIDMQALATELDVSRATLYRWVGSRELLLGEVLWSLMSGVVATAEQDEPGSGPAYVAAVLERCTHAITASEPMRRFLERDPQYALRVLTTKESTVQRRTIAALDDLLQRQVDAGALEPALDLETLSYILIRVAESFLYSDVITGAEPDPAKAGQAFRAILGAPA